MKYVEATTQCRQERLAKRQIEIILEQASTRNLQHVILLLHVALFPQHMTIFPALKFPSGFCTGYGRDRDKIRAGDGAREGIQQGSSSS